MPKGEAMRPYFVLLVFFSFWFWFLAGCTLTDAPIYLGGDTTSSDHNNMGGGELVIQLPFADDEDRLCVQGAGGSFSHTGNSTLHDLDFDTSNSEDEELFAPIAGIARVHMESASTNFGYHVNIEIGDGTYVVIAHLSEIFVSDGDEVAAGQLLGYEL
ncbi:MAG: peptidoglycan DD-metalloendopeptidase family protein [Candidatus Uhrbacteria bacterium]